MTVGIPAWYPGILRSKLAHAVALILRTALATMQFDAENMHTHFDPLYYEILHTCGDAKLHQNTCSIQLKIVAVYDLEGPSYIHCQE